MALHCTACQQAVPQDFAVCLSCQNGYVSSLACDRCGNVVPRGDSVCQRCEGNRVRGQERRQEPRVAAPGAMVAVSINPASINGLTNVPGLPPGMLPERVPETYVQRRFGVESHVQMSGQDASILTEMGQVAMLLHALAGRMNELAGHMGSTRDCIKSCRILAMTLQEEIEVRRGPQGG